MLKQQPQPQKNNGLFPVLRILLQLPISASTLNKEVYSLNSYTSTHCLHFLTAPLPFSSHLDLLQPSPPSVAGLAKVPSDQRVTKSSGHFSGLNLLDLLAAFDTVIHTPSLKHLLLLAWHLSLLVSIPSHWLLLPSLGRGSLHPLHLWGSIGSSSKFASCSLDCLSRTHGLSHHLSLDVPQIHISGSGFYLHTQSVCPALSISTRPKRSPSPPHPLLHWALPSQFSHGTFIHPVSTPEI